MHGYDGELTPASFFLISSYWVISSFAPDPHLPVPSHWKCWLDFHSPHPKPRACCGYQFFPSRGLMQQQPVALGTSVLWIERLFSLPVPGCTSELHRRVGPFWTPAVGLSLCDAGGVWSAACPEGCLGAALPRQGASLFALPSEYSCVVSMGGCGERGGRSCVHCNSYYSPRNLRL